MSTAASPRQRILDSVPPYLAGYIAQAPEGDLLTVLEAQPATVRAFFSGLTEAQQQHRYAPGKWSPREILGHLNDCERVFQYRALRFARADATELPGFEENDWALASNAHERSLDDLLHEFDTIRAATLSLARSLTDDMLWLSGSANGLRGSVIGLLFSNAGHVAHHLQVIRERYL